MRIFLNDLINLPKTEKDITRYNLCPACQTELFYSQDGLAVPKGPTTCPVCNQSLPKYTISDAIRTFEIYIHKGRYTQEEFDAFCKQNPDLVNKQESIFSHSAELAFAFLHFQLQRKDEKEAKEKFDAFFARLEMCALSTENTNNSIKKDPEELKEYIKHLFNLETSIYSVSKRLREIYALQPTHERNAFRRKALLEADLRTQSASSKAQYDNALAVLQRIQSAGADRVHVARPPEPRKPSAPILEKPGLFNKKKVLAHNEELTAAYKEACQQYELDLAAHQSALEACAAKEAQLVQEAEAKYAQALSAAEAEVAKAKAQMEQSAANIDAQIEAACALPSPETVAKQMLDDEIAQAEKMLKELIECRNKLYACDVVFIKYRNMVALATFYEYLISGRCTTLEGPDGAYNIFESECRANQIIGQLNKIVDSLEQIKESQYLIYSQLKSINSSLTTMNATMQSMSQSLQSIQADASNMSGYMEKVAQNSDVIAHNTAVSAYYTKMNAELTNSLGYLVALH